MALSKGHADAKQITAVKVRKARVSDVAQIVLLARQQDEAKKAWKVNKRRSFTLQMRHVIKAANGHHCWVAVDAENKVLGYAFASMTYSPIDDGMWLHLNEVYVRPRMRSAGIGKRLMMAVKRASKKAKTTGFWLVTHPSNTSAQRFYRRNKMRVKSMKSCFWRAA
jgi:ribosomal protein S18 acetylase RimI-like enzyme